MGFLLGRKGRNETDGRRGDVAKKSAAVLAAIAVAGGSAVVGMPQAEAAYFPSYIYWEKTDRAGKPLGGSKWTIEFNGETQDAIYKREEYAQSQGLSVPRGFGVIDNLTVDEDRVDTADIDAMSDNATGKYLLSDLDPRPGHILIQDPLDAAGSLFPRPLNGDKSYTIPWYREYELEERESPRGYARCEGIDDEINFVAPSPDGAYETVQLEDGRFKHTLREHGQVAIVGEGEGWGEVHDKNFLPGAGAAWHRQIGYWEGWTSDGLSTKELMYDAMGRLPDEVISDEADAPYYKRLVENDFSHGGYTPIFTLGSVANCREDGNDEPYEDPTPTPSVTTETVTETPEPSTTTVTPPTTTVTLPSTVTATVTPPPATVTETPKTETTTATTTESATTTVTETPTTETVTETPQRETVTETPAPKTETVTETPKKETVTETPEASTETMTSTVTAPQVTVTETPKQVTETTTLPQKTVTQQVPTTVVKDQTETVKMPPVTVTETEKQEPTTVTATPEKVTETLKVPGKNTTVVVTEPGEPTTVRETVTEETTSVVPVVVDEPKPSAPAPAPAPEQAVETPVEVKQEPASGVRRVLATTGVETNVLLGLGAGVLAMLALVAIVRRKKA